MLLASLASTSNAYAMEDSARSGLAPPTVNAALSAGLVTTTPLQTQLVTLVSQTQTGATSTINPATVTTSAEVDAIPAPCAGRFVSSPTDAAAIAAVSGLQLALSFTMLIALALGTALLVGRRRLGARTGRAVALDGRSRIAHSAPMLA